MIVSIGEQGQTLFQVGIDLSIKIGQCATLIVYYQWIVGLGGIRQAQIGSCCLGVVSTAEHGREHKLGISASYESLAQLCLIIFLLGSAQLLNVSDSLVTGTNGWIVAIPNINNRLVCWTGVGNIFPSISLILHAAFSGPCSVVIFVSVVRIHFKNVNGVDLRISWHQQLAHILRRAELHTVIGQFVKVAIARAKAHCSGQHRQCYI